MLKSIRTKILVGSLALIFVVGMLPVASLADNSKARIEEEGGSLFLITPYLTVKLHENKPDIMFWMANESSKGNEKLPVYHVSFSHVAELYGDDLIVDSRNELSGKIYNLASLDWALSTENFTNELRATLVSETLSNGATISFVFHIYLEDVTITLELNDSTTVTYDVKALKEIKFDIIVENWVFSEGAQGLTFVTSIHELAYRHRVRSGDSVNNPEEHKYNTKTETPREKRENDPERWGVEFTDADGNLESYFAWTPEADIFDLDDNYIETVNVTSTVAGTGIEEMQHGNRRFGVDYVNLFLTYPNYGDGLKLVHDPTIAIADDTTSGLSWSAVTLIAIPIFVLGVVIIRRKRN
ncbi:MAG: hypothetical protein ACTSQE_08395 [Candidatus Heimdallarchaeaceae archaeon]